MIKGSHRKRPNLRVAVASVIGIFVSTLLPSAGKAGTPIGDQSDSAETSDGALSSPLRKSSANLQDADFPIRSTSPFEQARTPSPKKKTAVFRIRPTPRDGEKAAPSLPETPPAGFRVHAASRDGAGPLENEAPDSQGQNPPASVAAAPTGFRLHAESRDDVDSGRRSSSDSVPPIASGPADSSSASPSYNSSSGNPNPGFYPTKREWDTIGGYYPRGQGDNPGGPESANNTQAPSGLWPYPSAADPIFASHPNFFNAIDRYVGLFSPTDGINYQGKDFSTGGLLGLNGGLPFITRAFNPNRATFKLGPIYLDFLDVSASVLYSQYKGPEQFAPGQGAGWLEDIALDFRVVVPLAENLFIAASGQVYYLPKNGKVGFFAADANGLGAGLNAFLAYEKNIRGWWFTLTDRVGTNDRFDDLFNQVNVNEIGVAGRYRFGEDKTADNNHIDFFSDSRLYLTNTVDATLVGLLSPIWRLTVDLNRSDSWNFDDFNFGNQHYGVTTASATIDYYGQNWRFAPYLTTLVSTPDEFESFLQETTVGIRGPITERLKLDASVGFGSVQGAAEDRDSGTEFLYQVGLIHQWGPYTQQSIYGGNVLTYDEFGDRTTGRYIRYTLQQVLSRRLNADFYVQWQDVHDVDTGVRSQGPSGAVFLNYDFGEFTNLRLGFAWESFQQDLGLDYHRLVYSAQLSRRIRAGLTGTLLYQREQYQESGGGLGNFSENLVEFTLTLQF